MRVAIVYDRLNKVGGAEAVLLAFHDLFPAADWYTSLWNPATAPFSRTWNVHHFPYLHQHHEWFPWLMPFIFEAYDFRDYDLVISVGSAECKGIITQPGTFHLHYCLTPTRYLYSHAAEYLSNPLYRRVANYLRRWDQVAATRPDKMIAISNQVKTRIQKYYNRSSAVIFPPVNTQKFVSPRKLGSRTTELPPVYFLVVSRLVPYKKIDVLVRAFNLLPTRHLVIIGTGSQLSRLKRLAQSNIHFLGFVPDSDLPSYYQPARAYLQANEEDFGISMVEAQAAGIPVIAYGAGGAVDIVIPGQTGLLLSSNTPSAFVTAVDKLDRMSFDREVCRANAERFSKTRWRKQITKYLSMYDSQ